MLAVGSYYLRGLGKRLAFLDYFAYVVEVLEVFLAIVGICLLKISTHS